MTKLKTITLKPWMQYALMSVILVTASYFLALLMPSCRDCRPGDVMFLQVIQAILSLAFLGGAIASAIASVIEWGNQ